MAREYRDLFSRDSAGYARFRPRYPAELFEWLATLPAKHRVAWDCATGNGQAASMLCPYFSRVIGTDASRDQLRAGLEASNLSYCVGLAEAGPIARGSVDLVTVAQAIHWLDQPAFFAEVRRVVATGGALAVWGYGRLRADGPIEQRVWDFQGGTVGPFWPPERRQIDEEYRGVVLPVTQTQAPEFAIESMLTLPELIGYIHTWSAVGRYQKERGQDPVALLEQELLAVWGEPDQARRITWPLFVRAGRVNTTTTA